MKKLTSVILAAMLIMTGCGAANESRISLSVPGDVIENSRSSDNAENVPAESTAEDSAPSEQIDTPAYTVDTDVEEADKEEETSVSTETDVDTDIPADDTVTAEKEMPEADAAAPQSESKHADAVSSDTPSEAAEKTTPAAGKKDDANVVNTSAETKVGVVNSAPASKENNKDESKGAAAAATKKEEAPATKAVSDSKNKDTSDTNAATEPADKADDDVYYNVGIISGVYDPIIPDDYCPVGVISGVYDPIIMIPEEDPIETGEAPTAPATEPDTDEEVKYYPGVNVGVYDPIIMIPEDELTYEPSISQPIEPEIDPNCTVPGPSEELIPSEPEPAPTTPASNESPKGCVGGKVTVWHVHIPIP